MANSCYAKTPYPVNHDTIKALLESLNTYRFKDKFIVNSMRDGKDIYFTVSYIYEDEEEAITEFWLKEDCVTLEQRCSLTGIPGVIWGWLRNYFFFWLCDALGCGPVESDAMEELIQPGWTRRYPYLEIYVREVFLNPNKKQMKHLMATIQEDFIDII